nr:hypothetical protein [Lysobacter enzymogenes]
MPQRAVEGDRDGAALAVAVGQDQRRVDAHAHAGERVPVRRGGQRERRDWRSCARARIGSIRSASIASRLAARPAGGRQRGAMDPAGHLHVLAWRQARCGRAEHPDRIGGGGVAVAGVLQQPARLAVGAGQGGGDGAGHARLGGVAGGLQRADRRRLCLRRRVAVGARRAGAGGQQQAGREGEGGADARHGGLGGTEGAAIIRSPIAVRRVPCGGNAGAAGPVGAAGRRPRPVRGARASGRKRKTPPEGGVSGSARARRPAASA